MKIFNKHSIGNKITSMVIIFVALALLVIGIAVTVLSINTENQQIEERMNLQLSQIITEVEQSLDNHSKVVSSLSTTIGITGTQLTVPEYNALLTQYVGLNADTYGAGVWFDYNGYQPGIKYFGPYAYRDGGTVSFAEALYSTDEYDFPNQEWYLAGKNDSDTVAWSAPYQDETLGISLVTATQGFYDSNKQFKGVVNPIVLITELFHKAELGDFDSEIPDAIISREDELGKLGLSFQKLSENIQENIATLEQISLGNLNVAVDVKSDQDVQSKSLIEVVENLKNLEAEVEMLTQSATDGHLSIRGDAAKFQGKYRDIVVGVNNTLDAVVEPLTMSAVYVDKISRGEIPAKITATYHGDFNTIKENLNACIDNINALVSDVEMLAQAATEGQLEIQADATKHSGDFRSIIEGLTIP